MRRIEQALVDRVAAPVVLFELELVLGLYGPLLAFHVVRVEAWRDEELREAVESFRQVLRFDGEVVGCVVGGRIGVATTAMLADELRVTVDLRVLVRGDKQHVFDEVG